MVRNALTDSKILFALSVILYSMRIVCVCVFCCGHRWQTKAVKKTRGAGNIPGTKGKQTLMVFWIPCLAQYSLPLPFTSS